MKVLLYGRYGEYPSELEPLIKRFNLEILPSNSPDSPDVVLTFGGDGTLLGSERDYPGIPKLPLRDSQTCVKCYTQSNEELLEMLSQKKLQIKEFPKLQIDLESQSFTAINDVVIRNSTPNIALRFNLKVDSNSQSPEFPSLIGDGLVLSTPFGSSAYFYSIARMTFDSGIGLAFNNIHNSNPKHQILDQNSIIEVEIVRGPADLAIDNDPDIIKLLDGAKITVKLSNEIIRIFGP